MYSYEDRIRAVKLYIKLGKRAATTVRQLGYPNVKALRVWCREYEQSHDLKVGRARNWHRYSDEQKQAAVAHYLEHGHCLAETVKVLGYPCSETLNVWIEELHPELRHPVLGNTAGMEQLIVGHVGCRV